MPTIDTPTTAEINDLTVASLEAALNQTIPLLPLAFNRVLAKAVAAIFVMLYKYAGFIFLQIFVKTAAIEEVTILGQTFSPLIAWGELIGVGQPVAAVQAELVLDVTVVNQGGTLLPGVLAVGALNGVTYTLIDELDLNAPLVEGLFRAVADQAGGNGAGAVGNLNPGDVVSFPNPTADVNRDATVNALVVPGADREATELYRGRIEDRFQKRPQGGAPVDYELWGEEQVSVINIYPYTGDLSGEVDVYAETNGPDPDGFPTVVQLIQVEDLINANQSGRATRRPANAFPNIYSITRTGFNVTIIGLTVPSDLGEVQSAIESELTTYLLGREPFVSGVTVLPRKDQISRSGLIGVVVDIVDAAGGAFTTLTVNAGGGNLDVYTLGIGEKCKLLTVSFSGA